MNPAERAALVERLEKVRHEGLELDCWAAADEITRLSAEVERLRETLAVTAGVLQAEQRRRWGKPFSGTWSSPKLGARVTVDQALDAADAALAPPTSQEGQATTPPLAEPPH